MELIRKGIADVPDFPKPGIVFKDITPLLENPELFRLVIQEMAKFIPKDTTKLVGIESRGFILGAALALHLGKGLVLCRKPGKLPRETLSVHYELEYGTDTLEIHTASLSEDDRIVIVDDVLATGGTAQAAAALCEQSGCKVLGFSFLMELEFLQGKSKLTHPHSSLVIF